MLSWCLLRLSASCGQVLNLKFRRAANPAARRPFRLRLLLQPCDRFSACEAAATGTPQRVLFHPKSEESAFFSAERLSGSAHRAGCRWTPVRSSRNSKKTVYDQKHLRLEDLKNEKSFTNGYINNVDLQMLPTVEFHVSKVNHVTGITGLDGILDLKGFEVKPREGAETEEGCSLLWWGLSVDKEDIDGAEQRFLNNLYTNWTPEQASKRQPFLQKLTTSPAFQEESRYGTFKFTFSLSELLRQYSEQICGAEKPTLRVYKTEVYKLEIMHVILVHSPAVHCFHAYPELQDNSQIVCALGEQQMVWRPQAISDVYKFDLVTGSDTVTLEETKERYFVWEHVTLAFHLPQNETLYFTEEKLLNSLTACKQATINLCHDDKEFSLQEAQAEVEKRKNRINLP
ncbi:hypothetical protein GN956_G22178 [Arapaima gigas]